MRTTRREFLKTSAGLALGAGMFAPSGAATGAWAVACRDVYLKDTAKKDCWAALAFLGVSGIELDVKEDMFCPAMLHPEKQYALEGPGLDLLADDLAAAKATVTALCMHNRLDERLEQELEWTRKVVVAAQRLKVGVIRIDVVPRKTPIGEFMPVAIDACRKLCEIAAGGGVRLAVENHGKWTNDPQVLDQLFDGVGSDRLGLTLDPMNLYWFGHPLDDVYRICEKFAPRAFHTHCKNLSYPKEQRNVRREMGWQYKEHAAPVYEGDVDFRRVAAILRKAGYSGDLCLENESLKRFPPEEWPGVLKRELAFLKRVAAS